MRDGFQSMSNINFECKGKEFGTKEECSDCILKKSCLECYKNENGEYEIPKCLFVQEENMDNIFKLIKDILRVDIQSNFEPTLNYTIIKIKK